MSFFRPPRKISFTREGLIFTGLTLPIGMAAVNTGNNMLYLILGLMLSIIALNGIFSESTVKDIEITLKLPQRVYVKESLVTFVDIENQKKFFPSFLMRASHLWAVNEEKKRRKKKVPPLVDAKQAYCIKVLPKERIKIRVESIFSRRGRYVFNGLKLATRFPFGLFDKSRNIDLPSSIIVYPERKLFTKPGIDRSTGLGQYDHTQKGLGGDLYALRPYTLDDDARHIHWRLSAKAGVPVVREFEATGQEKTLIFFDPCVNKPLAHLSEKERTAFEQALSSIAYLIDAAFQKGQWIGFATPEREFKPERGEDHFIEIMDYVACIEPMEKPKNENAVMFGRGSEVIRISPQDFLHG